MSSPHHLSNEVKGIGLALLAVIIWGGNFVIARSVVGQIGPVSLGFFRWLIASVIMIPIAWTTCKREWNSIRQNIGYLSITALFGITLFNTLVYVAGHYTGAINMAMIGTTSSPIFSILAGFFYFERATGFTSNCRNNYLHLRNPVVIVRGELATSPFLSSFNG